MVRETKFITITNTNSCTGMKDFGSSLATHLASRGITPLLLYAQGECPNNGIKDMRSISSIANKANSDIIRSYLATNDTHGICCLRLYSDESPADMHNILSAFSLVISISSNPTQAPIKGFGSPPLIFLIENLERGTYRTIKGYIDTLISTTGASHPRGFVIGGFDRTLAARLAEAWSIPFLGFADDIDGIAGRILEIAAPLSSSYESGAPIQTGTDNNIEALVKPSEHSPTNDKTELLISIATKEVRDNPDIKSQLTNTKLMHHKDNLKMDIKRLVLNVVSRHPDGPHRIIDEEYIVKRVIDDTLGFGPIEGLIADPNITEIMVNGPEKIHIEIDGVLNNANIRFRDKEHVLTVVERLLAETGRRLDESSPMVDARLPDGSRLNVIIQPVAIGGPFVTIRKFAQRVRTSADIITSGMLTTKSLNFLIDCIRKKISMVISGGTGTGKTTLLNILAAEIEPAERIITIEDAAELNIRLPHVVRLESRPPSIDGTHAVTIKDLVKNALRMRPDRIIIGECRGGEALDMLQAMNTGHEGSLTTVHANSPRDALSRIETMVLMAGRELPLASIRDQITRAIKLIIQISRAHNGKRQVTEICEVTGMEGQIATLQTLAAITPEGGLEFTGLTPRFAEGNKRGH